MLRKILPRQCTFAVLLLMVTTIATMNHSVAATLPSLFDCSETTLSKALWRFSSGEYQAVLGVQLKLDSMGFDPNRDDGIIGPDTLGALKDYCEAVNRGDAEATFGDLLESIFNASAVTAMDALGVEYVISQSALDALRAQGKVMELFEDLKGQTFATKAAFQAAVEPALADFTPQSESYFKLIASKLEATIAQAAPPTEAGGEAAVPVENETRVYRVTEASIAAVIAELKLMTIPDDVLSKLEALLGVAYPDASLLEHGLRVVLEASTDTYYPAIASAAKVGHDPELSHDVVLDGASCGCARDLNGIVYGFYPFWFGESAAGETAEDGAEVPTTQKIDFSILTRLAYFALSLDEQGNLGGVALDNDKAALNRLVSLAHRYKSKVDVVIYNNDWSFWPTLSEKRKDIYFNTLRKNIIDLLKTRSTLFFDKTLPYVSFGTHSALTLGDGVTLYFDRYPDDDGNFLEFIKRLRADLDALAQHTAVDHYYLNLMLSMDALDDGVYDFEALKSIIPDDESMTEDYVDLLIMHLEAPTTDKKKALRIKIENGFKGIQRRNVLRKIVPVITPIGHEQDPRGPYQQFFDDLVYFQDNFAGVGFWPLPSDQNEGLEHVKEQIIDVFEQKHDQDMLERLVTTVAPEFCQFACPNRWLLRILFDVIVACLIIYALLSINMCRLKKLYKKHVLYFFLIALTAVAIILILFVCDPFWKARADDVAFGILLLISVLFVLNYVRKAMRGPLP